MSVTSSAKSLNFLQDDSPGTMLFDKNIDFSRNGSTTKTSSPIEFTPGIRERGLTERVISTSPDTHHLVERQAMWDKQAQSADQKQAELFHIQWNLIREQMSTFSRETIQIRSDLQTFKEEFVGAIERERDARELGDSSARSLGEELKKALEVEVSHRIANHSDVEKNLGVLRSSIDAQSRQEAALEKTVASLSEELRKMQTTFRGDLETESRNRQTADERILAELQQANAATNRNLDTAVQKLENAIDTLRDALRREAAERHAEIQDRCAQNAEELSKYMRDSKHWFEKELHDRGAADDALNAKIQEIGILLDKERADRKNNESALLGQLGDLKQELALTNPEKSIRELKAILEDEAKKRSDADERLSAFQNSLQTQLEAEGRERARIIPELNGKLKLLSDAITDETGVRANAVSEIENGIRSLRSMLEQESKTRAADRVLIEEELARLRTDLVSEARTRKESLTQANMDFHEALKSLSDLLAKEAQERIACDEETSRAALQAKQAVEKETRDRAATQSEILTRLKELSTALEEERRERENGDRNQLAETKKEVEAEKGERRDEVSALKQSLRTVESTIASGLKSLRGALDAEEAERKDEQRNVTLNMTRLQNQQEAESRELARIAGELNDRLRALSDAIGIEATERKECDAELERSLRDLSAAFDREARQWSQAFKGVQDLIKSEGVEREAGDDAAAKSLKAAVQRMETITEKVRDALWVKMLALADRFFEYSREWRETPPTLDFSAQSQVGLIPVGHVGNLALR